MGKEREQQERRIINRIKLYLSKGQLHSYIVFEYLKQLED